ncbi:S-layer homology domain-containing protein [Lysinibacillus sphaericus]|uniref:S-layer homology domain-containing protein n=1 Tax=Lysinibacillus sphaericus TaxID=1421 RepID=UPI001911133C|nr:S-layer homology domain-containing protein [Lysinibacillus sphaericus]QPA54973.1 S-layer homology domain-containing protein [Lysinibacillus sphaericus]
MAKQNKGRKFFAASATAALVASAIVPVASAAQLNDFNKISGYAKEAVQSLVDAGVIQGDANGNFNPLKTISRAEAATIFTNALELEAEGDVNFKDVKADAWYYDAIAATVENGIFEGVSATEFAPNKQLTRSEAAKILVDAFELEGEGDLSEFADASTVKPWAKSYLEIAVANGVIKGSEANGKTNLNPNAPITRQDFAVVFSRTIENVDATPKVDKIEVVDAKTLNVTLSDGTKETVTLEKALEPNKETEVTFKIKDVEYKAKVTYVVTTATAVKSVSATNLKEVVVEFDGKVDKATATDVDNYEIKGKVLKTATLSEDGKSVTLTLDTVKSTAFANQVEQKLTFSNVKAGDKEISVKDYKFTPVDATIPTVVEVKALGNKTLSVKFSEPVKTANTNNFTIDGKTVVGEVKVNGNNAIVKLYTSLEDGEHTVAVKDVTDFADFKSLNSEHKFNVVKDVTAPTLSSVEKATFEKVTIKFSEQVDPDTVTTSSAYWLQGTSKKYPTAVTQISEDTFEFDFSNNKIQYTTDLFVTGVKDYSSNVIAADSKIQVNPVIDQTRPEVSSLVYDEKTKELIVKFNKGLDKETAEKAANYVIKDADGKVVSKYKTPKLNPTNNKEVKVQLVDGLTAGKTYTVEVAGVSDNTTLKNVMLPYSKSITVGDTSEPNAKTVVRNKTNNTLIVNFDKKMAVSGDGNVTDASKYLYMNNKNEWKKLPTGSSVNISPDGKSSIIQLPTSEIKVEDIKKVRVQLVKDDKDNFLAGLTQDIDVADQSAVTYKGAEATANNKISVEFSRSLLENTLNINDFKVSADNSVLNVISAKLDKTGTKVELTLADSNLLNDDATYSTKKSAVKVEVVENASTATVDGTKVSSGSSVANDKISAEIKTVKGFATGGGIEVTFGEALQLNNTLDPNAASDFIITNDKDAKLVPGKDYTVATAGEALEITFLGALQNTKGVYSVSVSPRFLTDVKGNLVKAVTEADAFDVYVDVKVVTPTTPTVDKVLSTATSVTGTADAGTTVSVKNTATGVEVGTATATTDGKFTATIAPQAAGTVLNVTATSAAGVVSAVKSVTVEAPVAVDSITVTGTPTTITDKDGTLQLTATVAPATATNKTVTWSVNDTTIATIDPTTGILTAKANGTVTVTATAADGSTKTGTLDIVITGQ